MAQNESLLQASSHSLPARLFWFRLAVTHPTYMPSELSTVPQHRASQQATVAHTHLRHHPAVRPSISCLPARRNLAANGTDRPTNHPPNQPTVRNHQSVAAQANTAACRQPRTRRRPVNHPRIPLPRWRKEGRKEGGRREDWRKEGVVTAALTHHSLFCHPATASSYAPAMLSIPSFLKSQKL